jgi:DNA-binding transcriptional MerR regulator
VLAPVGPASSRTLRHYDAIGLLRPAWVAADGHRHYEQEDLLRLQEILVLRELGLSLAEIATIVDRQADRVEALRMHHERLVAERGRLATLARTVARTIAELEEGNGGDMPKINRPENLFEGFDASRYDAEARERWPEQAEEARRFVETLTAEDTERMQREATARMIRMDEFMAAGTAPDDPMVMTEVDLRYQGVCRFWTPDAAAYKGLGRTYAEDPQWRSVYDGIAEGLADYQRDAMIAYADARLV